MQLFEMQGLLAGKCLPGDIKVNESLAEYFLRQFNQRDELARQVSALQLSHGNIINSLGIKGDGPVSKLVIEYVHGLVAENAAISDRLQKLIQIVNNADNSYCMCGDPMKNHAGGGCGSPTGMFDYHYNAWLLSEKETPATDAFTAELRAQGVDEYANAAIAIVEDERNLDIIYAGNQAKLFAANLRAGRKG